MKYRVGRTDLPEWAVKAAAKRAIKCGGEVIRDVDFLHGRASGEIPFSRSVV
jgi:hypothetical protein